MKLITIPSPSADDYVEQLFRSELLRAYEAGRRYAGIPTSEDVIGCKVAAKLLLADRLAGLVIPSQEEWIGVNLLERDDEL